MDNLEPRRRGRVPMTSPELIARAAIEVGFEDLTMAKVANSLGMKHSSLYRHVSSREELVGLAVDLLIMDSRVVLRPQDWRSHLEQLTDAIWDQFERFPGLAAEVLALPEPPAGLLWVFASSAGILMSFGFSAKRAMMITDLLCEMTVSGYLDAARIAKRGAEKAAVIGNNYRSFQKVRPDFQLNISEDFSAALSMAFAGQGREWWQQKRTLLLDALAGEVAQLSKLASAEPRPAN